MPKERIEQMLRDLQELGNEVAGLQEALREKDREIAALREGAIESDDFEDMETRKLTKEQLREEIASVGQAFNAKQAEADAKALKVLGSALSKLAASGQLRETVARAVRYYVKTPAVDNFGELVGGTRLVEDSIGTHDGRKLGDTDLLDDTQSTLGLGISLGNRGILLKDRLLSVDEKYRHILLSCLRHYLEDAIEASTTEMVGSVAVAVEKQLRNLVPTLPR